MKTPFLNGVRAVLCACTIIVSACSNEPTTPAEVEEPGTISITFDNVVGPKDLKLGTTYTTAGGEPYSINTLKYFVSNFTLTASDGSKYVVPAERCYFLIDESDATKTLISIPGIPANSYSTISYMIGVDSARSVADVSVRTGALDPAGAAEDMYWTWNSGYIFFKMEGLSDDSTFLYHIGGFGGLNSPTINNIRTVTHDLAAASTVGPIRIDEHHINSIHIIADIAAIFDGPTPFKIADNRNVMFAPFSTTVSGNYATMFSIDHIHMGAHED